MSHVNLSNLQHHNYIAKLDHRYFRNNNSYRQKLTVTSVYFLFNNSTPIHTNGTSKDKVNLLSAIGSAGGFSYFLCVCYIIISLCISKNFRNLDKK